MTQGTKQLLTRRRFGKTILSLGAASVLPGWVQSQTNPKPLLPPGMRVGGPNSLRAHAAARGRLFGVAVDPAILDVETLAAGHIADRYTLLVATQASILVAENAMKWAALRPTAAAYDFALADRLMQFAEVAHQSVRGHNLCWHQGLPSWFKETATKENARGLLTDHIKTVAGRYRGLIHSWDVVNEALDPADQRPDGLRKSPWLELVGPDYIELAFRTAGEADPQARLTYNEFGIELDTPEQSEKRGQLLLLLRRLRAQGVPVHAVGVQSHLQADGPQPGAGLQSFIREAAKMDLEVYITEMDVNSRSIAGGTEEQDAAVAKVYTNYLNLVLAEPNVPVVLTWGVTNALSWLNDADRSEFKRPDGSPQRPLPFDDNLKPTPAFHALRAALDGALLTRSSSELLAVPAGAVPPPVAPPPSAPAAAPVVDYQPFSVKGSPTLPPSNTGPHK
jgi:endo-1,4-beta-xylanase